MLILTRKTNEKIRIPKDIKVFRQEVFNAIQNENRAAVVNTANLDVLSRFSLKQK